MEPVCDPRTPYVLQAFGPGSGQFGQLGLLPHDEDGPSLTFARLTPRDVGFRVCRVRKCVMPGTGDLLWTVGVTNREGEITGYLAWERVENEAGELLYFLAQTSQTIFGVQNWYVFDPPDVFNAPVQLRTMPGEIDDPQPLIPFLLPAGGTIGETDLPVNSFIFTTYDLLATMPGIQGAVPLLWTLSTVYPEPLKV